MSINGNISEKYLSNSIRTFRNKIFHRGRKLEEKKEKKTRDYDETRDEFISDIWDPIDARLSYYSNVREFNNREKGGKRGEKRVKIGGVKAERKFRYGWDCVTSICLIIFERIGWPLRG